MEKALHVLVLNDYCYVQGGASRVAIDEAVGLAEIGVTVTFIGAVGPACAELRAANLRIVDLGQRELSDFLRHPSIALRSVWNTEARARVAAILATLPADSTIVHVHGYTKSLSTGPIRLAADRGFAVVCTLHDFFSACPNGSFFNFPKNQPCTLRGLSAECLVTNCDKRHIVHKGFRVARSLIQRHVGRFPDVVTDFIALSKRSAQILRPYLPPSASIYHLANPTNVERKTPVSVAKNRAIVSIGRLDTEKGTEVLVDAARQSDSPLTLVGDGPWRSYAEQYPRCRVTGWLSRGKVVEELEHARCLVFPSLWYETFGLVVEEAAARGVPAIVSDITAAAERVHDNVTGWHAVAGDRNDLARCLSNVKDDLTVQAAGTRAFEAFWADAHTPRKHAAELVQIYASTLGKRLRGS